MKTVYQNELDRVCWTPAGREALTDALMRGAAPAPRRINWAKRSLAASLAAVVLVGFALAVSGPLWNRFFGELDEDQQAVVETLSQDLPAAECNGVVMTPLEALGDEDFYYLMLEITPPKGMILPVYGKGEGFYQFFNPYTGENMSLLDSQGNDVWRECDYRWLDRTDDSSPLTAVIRFWPEDGVSRTNGTDKFLHLPGLWVQSPDKEYTEIFTGDWCFNIGAHNGGIESRELDVSGITISLNYCESLALDSMRISPLGMRWHCHYSGLAEEAEYPAPEVRVVMKDGSEIQLDNSMTNWNPDEQWTETYGPFEAPVNLDKAAYIRWGTAQIPLN